MCKKRTFISNYRYAMFVSNVNGVSSAGGGGGVGGKQRTTKRSESGAGNWGPAEMEEMALLMASLMMITVLVTFVLLLYF